MLPLYSSKTPLTRRVGRPRRRSRQRSLGDDGRNVSSQDVVEKKFSSDCSRRTDTWLISQLKQLIASVRAPGNTGGAVEHNSLGRKRGRRCRDSTACQGDK